MDNNQLQYIKIQSQYADKVEQFEKCVVKAAKLTHAIADTAEKKCEQARMAMESGNIDVMRNTIQQYICQYGQDWSRFRDVRIQLVDASVIESVVDMMDKYNMGYGSVNHNRNRCLDCGYENADAHLEVCPKCGSHHIDKLQRITGYLVGTTDRWNSGKLAELHDRVTHIGGEK